MTRSTFVGQQLESRLVAEFKSGKSVSPDAMETRVNLEGEEAKTAAAEAAAAAIAASQTAFRNNFDGSVFVNNAVFDEESIAVGKIVYLGDNATWMLLDGTATFTGLKPTVGVVVSHTPKKVQIAGIVLDEEFDTAGNYYVDETGGVTTTPSNYILGVCLSAGVLLLGAQTTTFGE